MAAVEMVKTAPVGMMRAASGMAKMAARMVTLIVQIRLITRRMAHLLHLIKRSWGDSRSLGMTMKL